MKLNSCVWNYACICRENCNCSKYIDVNSKEGGKILVAYTQEVNKAIEPVIEKWKETFQIYKSE